MFIQTLYPRELISEEGERRETGFVRTQKRAKCVISRLVVATFSFLSFSFPSHVLPLQAKVNSKGN